MIKTRKIRKKEELNLHHERIHQEYQNASSKGQ